MKTSKKTSKSYLIALGTLVLTTSTSVGAAPPVPTVEGACRNVPEAETHLAVLLSPDDVLKVEPLAAREHANDPTVPPGDGARIVVAAQPFVTAAWLREVVDCHVARRASSMHALASQSPLDVAGASVSVTSAPGILNVDVTSSGSDAAREILRRALALRPSHPPTR